MQEHGVDIPLDADHFFELIRLLGLLRGEWFFILSFVSLWCYTLALLVPACVLQRTTSCPVRGLLDLS